MGGRELESGRAGSSIAVQVAMGTRRAGDGGFRLDNHSNQVQESGAVEPHSMLEPRVTVL